MLFSLGISAILSAIAVLLLSIYNKNKHEFNQTILILGIFILNGLVCVGLIQLLLYLGL